MKQKLKRMAALACALFLIGLFAAAIILAVTGAPKEQLMAVILSILFFSILFYAMGLMTRLLKNAGNPSEKPNAPKDDKPEHTR